MKGISLHGRAFTALNAFASAILFSCQVSCNHLPEADSFAAPQMESIRVLETGYFELEVECRIEGASGKSPEGANIFHNSNGSQFEYGFYLQRLESAEVLTVNGKICSIAEEYGSGAEAAATSYTIVATATGLSSGTEYNCTAFARNGEYEILSGSMKVKTAEPFKDENFKAYALANFDADRDGGISQNEAYAVDTIKVVTDNIADLSGIEIFPNLYYLYCAGISEDKFKFDAGLEGALTALDLSKNTKLDYLSCGHNRIAELNLQNNKQLRYLDCNNTLITALDLSSNKNIENLEAHDCNRLTDIKFAQGGNIRSIFMCNCNFMQIDITMLPYIDAFNCSYSQHLETLNFSANRYMKVLGVAGLPLLRELDLSNNEFLGDLDCDWCQSLETVWLHKDAKLYRVVKQEHTNLVYKQ